MLLLPVGAVAADDGAKLTGLKGAVAGVSAENPPADDVENPADAGLEKPPPVPPDAGLEKPPDAGVDGAGWSSSAARASRCLK